jgi:hypothetical protein
MARARDNISFKNLSIAEQKKFVQQLLVCHFSCNPQGELEQGYYAADRSTGLKAYKSETHLPATVNNIVTCLLKLPDGQKHGYNDGDRFNLMSIRGIEVEPKGLKRRLYINKDKTKEIFEAIANGFGPRDNLSISGQIGSLDDILPQDYKDKMKKYKQAEKFVIGQTTLIMEDCLKKTTIPPRLRSRYGIPDMSDVRVDVRDDVVSAAGIFANVRSPSCYNSRISVDHALTKAGVSSLSRNIFKDNITHDGLSIYYGALSRALSYEDPKIGCNNVRISFKTRPYFPVMECDKKIAQDWCDRLKDSIIAEFKTYFSLDDRDVSLNDVDREQKGVGISNVPAYDPNPAFLSPLDAAQDGEERRHTVCTINVGKILEQQTESLRWQNLEEQRGHFAQYVKTAQQKDQQHPRRR